MPINFYKMFLLFFALTILKSNLVVASRLSFNDDSESSSSPKTNKTKKELRNRDSKPEKTIPQRSKEQQAAKKFSPKEIIISDDEILRKYNINIGKTSWKGGISVSGISCFYKDEIKEPLFNKISQFYKDEYFNNCEDYFLSSAFKGFVFDACTFDNAMFEDSFFSDLGDYSLRYKRKNSKKMAARTIYFKNCKLHIKNKPLENKDSVFFKNKIVGGQFENWQPPQ